MTKPVARRVIAGGCNARVFSQTTPTNLKSHTPRAGANHGAGFFTGTSLPHTLGWPLFSGRLGVHSAVTIERWFNDLNCPVRAIIGQLPVVRREL
jgi:hypothetical protein